MILSLRRHHIGILSAILVTGALSACGGVGGLPSLSSGGPAGPMLETGVTAPMASAGSTDTAEASEPELVDLPRYSVMGQSFAPTRGAKPALEKPAAATAISSATQAQFSVVTLFYATNRVQLSDPAGAAVARAKAKTAAGKVAPMPKFGADRARHLTLGFAQVTVPNIQRATGTIKRPRQITVLSVDLSRETEDPRKHFTIGNLQVLDSASFYRMASAQGSRPRDFKDHAMIFVHGYNTSFEEAIFRTAQLSHDIGFDGVPYAFSWPSKGETLAYPYDRESADASHGHLADFIDLIAKRTTAKKIHIIAHSMGARLLVDALYPAKAPTSTAKSAKLGEIILAAADIDRSVLLSRADSIKAAGKPVTLYVSNNDFALSASRQFSQSVPRAGDANEGEPIVIPGIETIDISDGGGVLASFGIGTSIGHTTFAEKSHVLTDMALMMRTSVHPPNRRFPVFAPIRGANDDGTFWRYVRN